MIGKFRLYVDALCKICNLIFIWGSPMKQLGNLIMGAMTAVMAIGGLFVAANAGHGVPYYGGLFFFLFAVLFVFHLIRVSFDDGS